MPVRRFLTLCLVVALAGIAAAHAAAPLVEKPASDLDPFVGVVKKVQHSKFYSTVLVERDGKGRMNRIGFYVLTETKITFSDKRPATASDLKAGQRVTVLPRGNGYDDSDPPQTEAAAIVIAVEGPAKFRVKSSSNRGGYTFGKHAYTQVSVEGTLTAKGGTGQLNLDPNHHTLTKDGEVIGTTQMTFTSYEVKFVPIDKEGRGPSIYRLEGDKLPEQLSLAVPAQAGRPWRLLIGDEKGRTLRVILLVSRGE